MRFNPEFGEDLAIAVAIRRRDEVAVQQFLKKIATEVVDEFEMSEATRVTPIRTAEAKRLRDERLTEAMGKRFKDLKPMVDREGMVWLEGFLS